MKRNKFGLYDDEVVFNSGLPIYSFEDLPARYFPGDLWTYTDLKKVLDIKLTDEERDTMIVAFEKSCRQQRGYSALYSFNEAVNKHYGLNEKIFFPQFEE